MPNRGTPGTGFAGSYPTGDVVIEPAPNGQQRQAWLRTALDQYQRGMPLTPWRLHCFDAAGQVLRNML